MRLSDILPDVETDMLLKITTPDGKSYVLLYALAQQPLSLPPADVVRGRWENISNLTYNAFGNVDCQVVSLNGKVVLHASASHVSWSRGSVPFIFVAEDDLAVHELCSMEGTTTTN
jgi:hypothetical protein